MVVHKPGFLSAFGHGRRIVTNGDRKDEGKLSLGFKVKRG